MSFEYMHFLRASVSNVQLEKGNQRRCGKEEGFGNVSYGNTLVQRLVKLLKRGNFHTLLQPLYISQKNKRDSLVTAEEQLSEVISKTFFHGKTVVKHFQARDDSFPLSTLLEPKLLRSFPVCTPTAEKRTRPLV